MPDDPNSSPETNQNNNPFIRFKNHVNANIHAGLNTLTRTTSTTVTPSSPTNMSDPSQSPSSSSPSQDQQMDLGRPAGDRTSHVESRIDLLRGATAPEAALAWRLFLTRSAYSPLRLECEYQLPRPRPRDLSAELPEEEVGWLEAFEDLMRVSSGLGLSDLREREREREGEWFALPFGTGFGSGWGSGFGWGHLPHPHRHQHHQQLGWWGWDMREVAWLERMKRQGLTEVLFPVHDPTLGYRSPATAEEWAERRRAEAKRDREAGRMWEELVSGEMRALEEARREAERETDAWDEDARRDMKREVQSALDDDEVGQEKSPPSFFVGIGGIVKTLGKVLEDEVKSMQRFGKSEENKDETASAKEKNDDAPETENDLYSVIQSAFHESERSLSNFFKSISDSWRDGRLQEPKPASPPKVETTEVVEHGITKKTTKKEFVDVHGNTHSKTETTWTDEDGRVVMTQVHSSTGRSSCWEKTLDAGKQDKENKKESGWFWK